MHLNRFTWKIINDYIWTIRVDIIKEKPMKLTKYNFYFMFFFVLKVPLKSYLAKRVFFFTKKVILFYFLKEKFVFIDDFEHPRCLRIIIHES